MKRKKSAHNTQKLHSQPNKTHNQKRFKHYKTDNPSPSSPRLVNLAQTALTQELNKYLCEASEEINSKSPKIPNNFLDTIEKLTEYIQPTQVSIFKNEIIHILNTINLALEKKLIDLENTTYKEKLENYFFSYVHSIINLSSANQKINTHKALLKFQIHLLPHIPIDKLLKNKYYLFLQTLLQHSQTNLPQTLTETFIECYKTKFWNFVDNVSKLRIGLNNNFSISNELLKVQASMLPFISIKKLHEKNYHLCLITLFRYTQSNIVLELASAYQTHYNQNKLPSWPNLMFTCSENKYIPNSLEFIFYN